MYVQATVFDNRTPQLPGNAEIKWQGIGDDYGYAIIRGKLDTQNIEYYIADTIGFQAALTYDFTDTHDGVIRYGTDTLNPVHLFPKSEWIGGAFKLMQDNGGYKLVFGTTPQWVPREWKIPKSDTDEHGEEIVVVEWWGDYWFNVDSTLTTFTRQGRCREYDPQDYTIAATVSWNEVWRHDGKGVAPAGEYVDENDNKRTVGFWNERREVYEIGGTSDENKPTIPMDMISLGLLRIPGLVNTSGETPEGFNIPDGWDFDGSDWENPDPWDARYWLCIRWAMLERESVLTDRRMGTLVQHEDLLFQMEPNNPPTFAAFELYQEHLKALANQYYDIPKLMQAIEDDEYIPSAGVFVSIDEDLGGGWEAKDTLQSRNKGDLRLWLKNAKKTLEKMGFPKFSRRGFTRFKSAGGVEYGNSLDGDNSATVYAKALNDYNTEWQNDPWGYEDHYDYELRPEYLWHAFGGSVGGLSTISQYSDQTVWIHSFGNNIAFICGLNVPLTSVIDGSPMPFPDVGYVVESKNRFDEEDYPVGGSYYYQYNTYTITSNEYWSDGRYHKGLYWEWMPEEGVEGIQYTSDNWNGNLAAMESNWTDEQTVGALDVPHTCPHPASPAQGETQGISLWGSDTTCWVYLWYGDSFRFKSTLPTGIDPRPDEEEEEEPEPAPQPQPEPDPEPSPSSRQAVDWEIASDVDDARELKGPGPYRLRAREDAYTMSRDGDGTPVLNPNLKYHYPVKWGTEESLFQKGKRYVTGWRKSWWLYSKEVPKLEVDELLGWVYYVFQTRPFVAYPSNKQYGAPNLSTMPTESIWEQFHRQTQRCINGPYSLPTVCYA